jgi:hypothetical protein
MMDYPPELPIQTYRQDYAKRHNLPLERVEKSRLLDYAAELEDLVEKGAMTTYIARRLLVDAFIDKYPNINRVSCGCKKGKCHLPCKLSAVKLIKRPIPKKGRKKR